VVAVVVGLYAAGVIGGGAGAGPGAAGDGTTPSTAIDSQPLASAPPNAGAATDTGPADTTRFDRPIDPDPRPRQTTGGGTATPPVTPTASPAGPSASQRLTDWARELEATAASDAVTGGRILRELAPMFDGLSGSERAEAHYVRMLAYASVGDNRTCADAREVIRVHSVAGRRARAQEFLDLACP